MEMGVRRAEAARRRRQWGGRRDGPPLQTETEDRPGQQAGSSDASGTELSEEPPNWDPISIA